MRRSVKLALLLAVGIAPAAEAQIAPAEYIARRDTLAARIGDGALIAFGKRDYVNHQFDVSQLPAFNYLTGFGEADAVLVMVTRDGKAAPTLFTVYPSIRTQLYDGMREAPAAVETRTGLKLRPLADLTAFVDSLVAARVPLFQLRDFETGDYAYRDTLTRGASFLKALRTRHEGVDVKDVHAVVDAMRARKSPAEVALLRRAIAITDSAHHVALGTVRPGAWEYEVEAAIEQTFRSRAASGPSFASIVGSGPNSTTLHYARNDRQMKAGEVVVMDIGALYEGYAADVTRTVPVSGRFSPEQRAIYDLVLAAQKAAERQVRPGAKASASLDSATAIRLEGLTRLGLIESPTATFDPPWPVDCVRSPDQCLQGTLFMIHGISHGIGLEVHDPAAFYTGERTYGVGDAFTIEPGIYINDQVLDLLQDTPRNRAFIAKVRRVVERYDDIGVRIEDDYLVTPTGVERLSTGSPREAEEIEAAMALRRR